jgi:hypothetical protein
MGYGIDDIRLIEFPKINDIRGNLSFLENNNQIPFKIKQTSWLFDIPTNFETEEYALKKSHQLIISVSGSFEVSINDGNYNLNFMLNKANEGLYIPNLLWTKLDNFSTNSVALFLCNESVNEIDKFRNFKEFLKFRNEIR